MRLRTYHHTTFQVETFPESFFAFGVICHKTILEHIAYDCDQTYIDVHLKIDTQVILKFSMSIIILKYTFQDLALRLHIAMMKPYFKPYVIF